MSFFTKGLFVVGGIIAGTTAIDYFVLGNTSDYRMPSDRLGPWREAQVRPACYPALESPEKDAGNPQFPPEPNRISRTDYSRTVELTAALNCYVVTQTNAVCEPSNRTYIVDYIAKYFVKKNEMMAIAKRYGRAEVEKIERLWDAGNNRAIGVAIENHIRNGRITRLDFGLSAPDELRPVFDKFANTPDHCPRERRWTAAKL
jgi:hypothetical protein